MTDYNAILKRLPVGSGMRAGIFAYLEAGEINRALSELDEWAAAHPVKTYAQDFFEKFPNAYAYCREDGRAPMCCNHQVNDCKCPYDVHDFNMNYCARENPEKHTACWNRPMPDAQQDC